MRGLKRTGLAAALLLAACGPDEFAARCEAVVKEALRSPSTYRAVEVRSFDTDTTPRVTIAYDAANAYGTPVRSRASCRFVFQQPRDLHLLSVTIDGERIAGYDLDLLVQAVEPEGLLAE